MIVTLWQWCDSDVTGDRHFMRDPVWVLAISVIVACDLSLSSKHLGSPPVSSLGPQSSVQHPNNPCILNTLREHGSFATKSILGIESRVFKISIISWLSYTHTALLMRSITAARSLLLKLQCLPGIDGCLMSQPRISHVLSGDSRAPGTIMTPVLGHCHKHTHSSIIVFVNCHGEQTGWMGLIAFCQ